MLSCLRHRFSGFVWQQEARPLRILGPSKLEKPLHPSSAPPQRNSVPARLNCKLPKEKSFLSALPEIALQSRPLLQDGRAPCPPVSVTGRESSPAPLPGGAVPACLQRLVRRRHPRRHRAAAVRGSHGVCRAAFPLLTPLLLFPGSSAGTGRSAANQTAAGGGEEMQPGFRNRTVGGFSWERRKRHARQAQGHPLGERREPPGCYHALPPPSGTDTQSRPCPIPS